MTGPDHLPEPEWTRPPEPAPVRPSDERDERDARLATWRAGVLRASARRAAWSAAVLVACVAAWTRLADPDLRTLGFIGALSAGISLWSSANAWRSARARTPLELADDAVRARAAYDAQAMMRRDAPFAARPARFTWLLLAAIAGIFLLQLRIGIDPNSVDVAGLIKPAVRAGEWWRLFTGTYLHGSFVHLLMNGSALYFVGQIMETHLPPLRLPLVYLAGLLGGSIASQLLSPSDASVGASGAIVGLIGFLCMVAWRNPRLLPAGLARGLGSSLVLTAFLGLVGPMAIDNSGHFGGALAGAALGLALYGRRDGLSPSAGRERALDALGWASTAVLVAGAAFTALRLTIAA